MSDAPATLAIAVDAPPPPPEEPHPDDHPEYKAPPQQPVDLLGAIKAGAALKSVPPPPVDGLGDHVKHGLMAEVRAEVDSMRRNSTLMDTFRTQENARGGGVKIVIQTTYKLKAGKTDDFKSVVAKLVDAVRTNEKSSSGYFFSNTESENQVVNFSFYESDSAALAHVRNSALNQLIPEMEAICEEIHMNVHGRLEERTRKAFLTFHDLNDFKIKTTLHTLIDSAK